LLIWHSKRYSTGLAFMRMYRDTLRWNKNASNSSTILLTRPSTGPLETWRREIRVICRSSRCWTIIRQMSILPWTSRWAISSSLHPRNYR
jgi:hypothetical protein